jgi:hypothetical protein
MAAWKPHPVLKTQQFLYYAGLALLPFLTFLVVMLLARHE